MSEGEARKLDSPLMIFSLDDEGARLRKRCTVGLQWTRGDYADEDTQL